MDTIPRAIMNSLLRIRRRYFGWIQIRRDLLLLVAVLIVIFGIWSFIELADEVSQGETQRLDAWIILAMREPGDPADPIGPPWFEEAMRDLSALGSSAVLIFFVLTVAGFQIMRRHYHGLALLLAATLGGILLTNILKDVFARPRPELVPHLSYVTSASFPSGHSILSAVVYLTLGALLARFVKDYRLRLYFLLVAIMATFLVGLTRVYLGVHYPTDVLAGWNLGLIWAVFCWIVASSLQRRGAVEPPSE